MDRRDFLIRSAILSSGLLGTGMLQGSLKAEVAYRNPKADGRHSAKAENVTVFAFKCGTIQLETQYILMDTRVGIEMEIPILFFLIEHGKEWIAFDTGMNAMVAIDPEGYWGDVAKAFKPVMAEKEDFKIQIEETLGLKPEDLKAVILSHGHLDHAGAIESFRGTDVPIYLQKTELDLINAAVAANEKSAYIPEDFKYLSELNIMPVEGIFDVFGDSTVVAFPSPGHTEGHQSVSVKSGNKTFILCADANYTLENMNEAIPPGIFWDISQSLQNLYLFKVMSMIDKVEVVPSHDPTYWESKRIAPKKFK